MHLHLFRKGVCVSNGRCTKQSYKMKKYEEEYRRKANAAVRDLNIIGMD